VFTGNVTQLIHMYRQSCRAMCGWDSSRYLTRSLVNFEQRRPKGFLLSVTSSCLGERAWKKNPLTTVQISHSITYCYIENIVVFKRSLKKFLAKFFFGNVYSKYVYQYLECVYVYSILP
jgi:hypothetical protein